MDAPRGCSIKAVSSSRGGGSSGSSGGSAANLRERLTTWSCVCRRGLPDFLDLAPEDVGRGSYTGCFDVTGMGISDPLLRL